MLPRSSDQLLLPANPWFIWSTLLMALVLNMIPLGRESAMPDLLMMALVFWNVHQPRRVGLGAAFVLGLLMDVHDGAILGQHALAYTLVSYLAISLQRRLLWFTLGAQALHVLPLFFTAHVISLIVRLMAGGEFPGWALLAAPLIESVLWPLVSWTLLAPQRRAPDPDKNRPL